jgi:hypothetical protein
MNIETVAIDSLKLDDNNARKQLDDSVRKMRKNAKNKINGRAKDCPIFS